MIGLIFAVGLAAAWATLAVVDLPLPPLDSARQRLHAALVRRHERAVATIAKREAAELATRGATIAATVWATVHLAVTHSWVVSGWTAAAATALVHPDGWPSTLVTWAAAAFIAGSLNTVLVDLVGQQLTVVETPEPDDTILFSSSDAVDLGSR